MLSGPSSSGTQLPVGLLSTARGHLTTPIGSISVALATFDRVMAGYELSARGRSDVNVLCTVNAANQHRPLDVYRFLRDDLNAQFIQFIPVVERVTDTLLPLANLGWSGDETGKRPLYIQAGDRVTDRSVSAHSFGRFLITIFDEWIRNDIGQVYVQHFDVALASWQRLAGGLCIFAETCGGALAMEHNGDLYSCDHYVEPDYLLGNITEMPLAVMVQSEEQRAFGMAKLNTLPDYCRTCEVRFACNGGCPKNRFTMTPDGDDGLNYLCAGYKRFFTHIDEPMRIMSDLLSKGFVPPVGDMMSTGS